MSSKNEFDLIIIGGGSAAFSAAIRANELKVNVLLINEDLPLGGTCVNVGCIPSKFLIRAAQSAYHASHSPFEGIYPKGADIDFKKIIAQKKALVNRMQQQKYLSLLEGLSSVSVMEGMAEFKDRQTVLVKGREYTAPRVIIASGSSTAIPPVEGLENTPYLVNDTLFDLEEQPSSLVILGGGYIGLEIAQAYQRLGTKVTVIEMAESVLPTETEDITNELSRHLGNEGIAIHTDATVKRVWKEKEQVKVEFEKGNEQHILKASHLLVATGRKANTDSLRLDKAGIETAKNGYIPTNKQLETNVPHIYAIGDVNTFLQFVYAAAYEGHIAVSNAFMEKNLKVNYSAIPWVVFTDPQVAGVGMDENKAKEKGIPFEAKILPLSEVPGSTVKNDTRGFIKLIRNPENDLLLGARILAPEGGELTMELSLAIKYKIPVRKLVAALHPYLTLSEGIKLTAMSFTTDLSKMSCCVS